MNKRNRIVCGDNFLCERTLESTEFVLCDGIGSGVYANIASITCASRLIELFKRGVSLRTACEMVADSMHRARSEDIPFSTFTVAKILNDGQFTIYTYEAPDPISIIDKTAKPLKPYFYTAGYEIVGEVSGILGIGDSLVLCSDGVTQAGLGKGHSLGIGIEGVSDYINHKLSQGEELHKLPEDIIKMSGKITDGIYADDTTVAVLQCREAGQLTVASGPPLNRGSDKAFAQRLLSVTGTRVVCGSTTAEILSRELNKKIKLAKENISFGSPPEYEMEGVDMVTEGAVMLNQAYNILGEEHERLMENTPAQRLCSLMQEADVVTFIIGNAVNDAHSDLIFKQLGIRPRKTAIKLISEELKKMGKLVVEEYY